MSKRFQDLDTFTAEDIDAALDRDAPEELQFVPLTVAMASPDLHAAVDVCIRLARHDDPSVRGNAIVSLGHLARRFRILDERTVKPLIEQALHDPDGSVRVLARAAADEIHQFLFWNIAGHSYGG
jgi:HEAT repeat protein